MDWLIIYWSAWLSIGLVDYPLISLIIYWSAWLSIDFVDYLLICLIIYWISWLSIDLVDYLLICLIIYWISWLSIDFVDYRLIWLICWYFVCTPASGNSHNRRAFELASQRSAKTRASSARREERRKTTRPTPPAPSQPLLLSLCPLVISTLHVPLPLCLATLSVLSLSIPLSNPLWVSERASSCSLPPGLSSPSPSSFTHNPHSLTECTRSSCSVTVVSARGNERALDALAAAGARYLLRVACVCGFI